MTRPYRPVTPADVEEVRRLAGEGVVDREIAVRLGRRIQVVQNVRLRYGIASALHRRLTPADLAAVRRLAEAGRTAQEIAAAMGWTFARARRARELATPPAASVAPIAIDETTPEPLRRTLERLADAEARIVDRRRRRMEGAQA
ncbi:hypothetical protein [Antarcticirhabdus aurantiaca]|uniref:hypothetical protein n=1 Tax=Antarcticirhabdus aurantiaca TaxID=2606717 RepID=UPI00131C8689|nr:hypothetical protein [Antarcticirhabdus aurantiaca]